jgi:hypothetical protein
MKDLCKSCKQAGTTCPVYAPGVPTYVCVEWIASVSLAEEPRCE